MRKEKWNGQPINTQKKSDILRPRKYLYADDSTFAAVSAARTGNILLNPLMTTTLMWKARITHSACCDSESQSCNPGSLQNALTRASKLIKGHQKYKGPAGHMVSKWLSKTMERNTGDKGLALEALLLFYIQSVFMQGSPTSTVLDNCCYTVREEKRCSILLSWHGDISYWHFLNSEPTIYHILWWVFMLRLETATSLQSLGTAFYLLLIICFSSCTADVLWRTWWKQCIIPSCSSNSYSRYMLGQG